MLAKDVSNYRMVKFINCDGVEYNVTKRCDINTKINFEWNNHFLFWQSYTVYQPIAALHEAAKLVIKFYI